MGLGICCIGMSFSCVESSKDNSGQLSDQWEVVASRQWNGRDSVVVCDIDLLKDTVDLPLSFFVEDFQIVKLDNSDEALVGITDVCLSENYILVYGSVFSGHYPCRLFTKEGRFVADVGALGQGPGEYRSIYGAQIDEHHQCIYLMPFANSNVIYVYDLEGKPLYSLPLHLPVTKAIFKVDTSKRELIVGVLPFKGYPWVAWVQDFEGHLIDSIPAPAHLSVVPDFSNEIMTGQNTDAFDLFVSTYWERRPDTLYHYLVSESRLQPCFTLDLKKRERPISSCYELSDVYLGRMSVEKQVAANMWETQDPSHYIVDKKTLKGSFFRVKNDFLGGMSANHLWTPWMFNNGYYALLVEPGQFKSDIDTYLASSMGLSEQVRSNLKKLSESIREEDNSYVIYAKQKGVRI